MAVPTIYSKLIEYFDKSSLCKEAIREKCKSVRLMVSGKYLSTRVETGHGKPGSQGKVMEIDLVWKSQGDLQKTLKKSGKLGGS